MSRSGEYRFDFKKLDVNPSEILTKATGIIKTSLSNPQVDILKYEFISDEIFEHEEAETCSNSGDLLTILKKKSEKKIGAALNFICNNKTNDGIISKVEEAIAELKIPKAANRNKSLGDYNFTTFSRNDKDGASASTPKIKKEPTPTGNNAPPQMDEHDFVDDVKPLNVVVKMAEEFLGDTKNKNYSLRSSPRGHALIINNIHFDEEGRNRSGGAELDASYMTQLWEQMGFQCHLEKDVYDKEELTSALDKFKKKFSRKKVDCCVVIIMSHGEHGQVFLCNDSKVNLWKDIVYQFDHDRAPHLKGTPKVFIVQACQDFRTGTDSSGCGSYPIEDTIVCFPSLPGHSAHRDHYKGSWFLYILTKVMMEEASRLHFVKILEKIQKEEMNRIRNPQNIAQLPTWTPFLFIQELFFNPGLQQ